MRPRLFPFVTPLAILPLLGCQTIIGAEFDSAKLAPSTTSCQPARPPVRPAHLPSAADSVDFTVVIDQLDFGDTTPDTGKSRPVGYDQDGVCTGADGPLSCTPYSWLDSMPEDGPGGRDDAVADLLKQQKSLFGISLIGSDEENEGIVAGLGAPTGILRVRDFSGLASDDHVTVELFQAAAYGLAEPPVEPDAVPKRPSFDASDHWPVVRATLEADGASPLESTQRDDDAFVIDNTLVAHFDMLQLPMHNVYVEAMQVAFTASLHYSAASGWTVRDGTLAGKIRTDFLLGFVPLATRSAVNVSLCTDDALNYKLAKTLLCQTADLPAEKGNRKSPCAFASVGVNFQSSPASLGPVVDVLPPASPCPPLTDPARDHCSFDPADQ